MALSGEDKLKNFADEAMGEARKISGEIETRIKSELTKKLKEGEQKIASRINADIRHETENIKIEQGLAVSQAEIRAKQDYFKYIDSVSERVLFLAAKKAEEFAGSEKYSDYLFECCKNAMQRLGADIDIFYKPGDGGLMVSRIKDRLGISFDLSHTAFISDETIKTGGLRFFCRAKGVFVNDAFEEKTERAKGPLHSVIGKLFSEVK